MSWDAEIVWWHRHRTHPLCCKWDAAWTVKCAISLTSCLLPNEIRLSGERNEAALTSCQVLVEAWNMIIWENEWLTLYWSWDMYICLVIVYFGHEVWFHSLPVSHEMRCNLRCLNSEWYPLSVSSYDDIMPVWDSLMMNQCCFTHFLLVIVSENLWLVKENDMLLTVCWS